MKAKLEPSYSNLTYKVLPIKTIVQVSSNAELTYIFRFLSTPHL